MKIIIIGAGEVGFYLAQKLSQEKHDIVVIDNKPDKCARMRESLDVAVIAGDAASQKVLNEAGLKDADLLIAASGIDEINLMACMMADKLGVEKKVARVRNPDYYEETSILKPSDLGVDMLINPEGEVIDEILRLLLRASASEVIEFEEGKIVLVGLKLDGNCPNINNPLREIGTREERRHLRVVAMVKGGKTIIPSGDDRLGKNDQIFVIAKRESLPKVFTLMGKEEKPLEKIMILGGGKIGRGLAQRLESKAEVTLVEMDREKSLKIASQLKKTTVYQADATEIDLLAKEGLLHMDALIAVTPYDETNILSCLLAKHFGMEKTIALINKQTYLPLLPVIGIDSTVNIHIATASAILRFIRRGDILSAAALHGIDAEVIEFEIGQTSKITKKPLKDLGLPKGSLIAAVVRGREVFIPDGNSSLEPNDKVIVFALPAAVQAVEKRFS